MTLSRYPDQLFLPVTNLPQKIDDLVVARFVSLSGKMGKRRRVARTP
ncbi:MAG TPA: hypothetical protein VMM76_25995 [Pirellulaceae bacterium]|nr:hypothetical protein [Pirellulaceae bacterium]